VSAVRVAVVGAGIGGLAIAAALEQAGIEAVVLEQAQGLGEVGAGISMSPNSLREVDRLGLTPALDAVAVERDAAAAFYTADCRVADVPSIGRGRATAKTVHRADLIGVLARGVRAGTIRLGSRVTRIEQDADGVTIGIDGGGIERFDAAIGADGIHSVVRGAVAADAPPVFSGMIAYRGLVPRARIPWWEYDELSMFLGGDRHFLTFPVRSGELINFVGFVVADDAMRESWSLPGDPAVLAGLFGRFGEPVRRFLAEVDTTFRTGLYDRDPLAGWVHGRIALAGDAAHAMLPHAGQGANQAIEDAAALAVVLAGRAPAELPAALLDYERARIGRASFIQLFSRRLGLEYDGGFASLSPAESLADKVAVRRWITAVDARADAEAVRAGDDPTPPPPGLPA